LRSGRRINGPAISRTGPTAATTTGHCGTGEVVRDDPGRPLSANTQYPRASSAVVGSPIRLRFHSANALSDCVSVAILWLGTDYTGLIYIRTKTTARAIKTR
jgi:hypothetical protein